MERGDPGAWFDSKAVAENYELVLVDTGVAGGGRSAPGREGFVEFFRTWTEEFEDWWLRLARFIDAGEDRVVVLSHQSATGKASGVPVELDVGQVVELEDERVVRSKTYLSHADALEAAGLRK